MAREPIFSWKRAIIVVIVFQVALGLIYLKTVPRIYLDYVWESSWGHSLAYTGTMKSEFVEGFGGMGIHFVQPRVVLPLVCAAIYKVVGFSVVSSRAGSLIFSVLAVIGIYAVMRRWFGEKQAVCISLATILHPWFFEVSRRVRPEIYYTALGVVVLWCIVRSLDTGSRRTAFFAGVLAGLTALAHPTGLVLDFAIAGAVLIWLRDKKIWRLALWGCPGFILAILPYIIYVLWSCQDPGVSFFEQMKVGELRTDVLAGEIGRWKNFLQWPKGAPLAVIMVASWLLAWYRSTRFDKVLASVVVLFSVVLPFASTNMAGRYLVAVVPFFCALMVRLIWRLIAGYGVPLQKWYKLRFVGGVSIVVIYVSMCLTGISLMFYCLRGADFMRVVDRVASVVGREDRVYGEIMLWLGNDRYRYGPYPIDYSVVPWRQTVDMVRRHHFDYAVRASWSFGTSHGIASPPAEMPDFRASHTVDQVCKQFGTKVDEFRDPYFGPFEIYKLNNWDDNSDSSDELEKQEAGIGVRD